MLQPDETEPANVRDRRAPITLALAILMTLGALVSACGGSDDAVEADLGVVLTLTGPSSIYGLSSQKGIELALEEINEDDAVEGVTINATIRDDAGNAQAAATLFQELIDDEVDVIAGPTLSNSAMTADPLAVQAGLPVLAISNTATGITALGETIFRIPLADANVVPAVIAVAVQNLGLQTAVLLSASDEAFATSTAEVMRQASATHGLEIVAEQQFLTSDTDFTEQLEAVQVADPDVILVSALATPTDALLIQAREMGIEQQIICGNQCNSPAFVQAAGGAAEGLLVGATWYIGVAHPASAEFVTAYRAKFGADPDQFAAQAYAAMYILADALERAGSDDPEDLRAALLATRDLDTPLGPFSFDASREPTIQPVVQVVENGAFAIFE
jgi:branched-chain amino acid transport system substrate-binding protein